MKDECACDAWSVYEEFGVSCFEEYLEKLLEMGRQGIGGLVEVEPSEIDWSKI